MIRSQSLITTLPISLAQNAASSSAGFGWDSAHPGTASWNTEESARYYQIQLVRNGIDTGIMRSVYKNHYDFFVPYDGAGRVSVPCPHCAPEQPQQERVGDLGGVDSGRRKQKKALEQMWSVPGPSKIGLQIGY